MSKRQKRYNYNTPYKTNQKIMTPQDYENEKIKRTNYAIEDFSKDKKYSNYFLIWSLILAFIWYYYNLNYLYIFAFLSWVIWVREESELNWYKKGFDYWFDEWYEVMQEKTENDNE